MSHLQKCIFFDRDGVINEDRDNYVYRLDHFQLFKNVPKTLKTLSKKGFIHILITNQAGISRGLYTAEDFEKIYKEIQDKTDEAFTDYYYSPYHPTVTKSLSRKPESLMWERAIAKHHIDPTLCWMVGDRDRDLIPAKKLGIKTIGVRRKEEFQFADYEVDSLEEIVSIII